MKPVSDPSATKACALGPYWRCAADLGFSAMLVIAMVGFAGLQLWAQSNSASALDKPPAVKSLPAPPVRTFPGPHDRLLSPDGRFVVTNHAGDVRSDNAAEHFLRLSDFRSGDNGLLFRYTRNVEVSWAPDSRALFINDNKDKDESQAYVFFPGDDRKVLNLGKKILDAYPDDLKLLKADHAYIRAVRWLSANEVVATLTGHEEKAGTGFTVCYIVNVNRTIRRTAEYRGEGQHCPQQ
jgi:hypothetical protein